MYLSPLEEQKKRFTEGKGLESVVAFLNLLVILFFVLLIQVMGAAIMVLFDPAAAKDILFYGDADYTQRRRWLALQAAQETFAPRYDRYYGP